MRRWLILALGTGAQTVACVFVYGLPYMSEELRHDGALSLSQVGLVVACPTAGLVLALVAWGALADRVGERLVITVGLTMTAVLLALGTQVEGLVPLGLLFALSGAASASVYAASGRLVMGWFSAKERGLAMGIRQTSTPLGMGVAALCIPGLAESFGVRGPGVFCAALCALFALLVGALSANPPQAEPSPDGRPAERTGNPYRNPSLWRIHGASALLCVPQFTASAFALVFLVDVRGYGAVAAGQLLAVAQVLGALSRVVAGRWSDRVSSRLRPMRQLACLTTVVLVATALGAVWPSPASDTLLVIACGITASTNGLAFTAVAELAGRSWSGRAMGVQNTGQNLAASMTPPLLGSLIGAAGYAAGFGLAAVVAGLAAMTVPPAGRRPGAAAPAGSGPVEPAKAAS
ncbi:MFS transporter [Streptomyces sp. NPDC059740]|uniref:MFS transporter n=1 Tax=Streptomyces sp. NPDC059740 TaxID=3346926 RepID=UPI003668AD51